VGPLDLGVQVNLELQLIQCCLYFRMNRKLQVSQKLQYYLEILENPDLPSVLLDLMSQLHLLVLTDQYLLMILGCQAIQVCLHFQVCQTNRSFLSGQWLPLHLSTLDYL